MGKREHKCGPRAARTRAQRTASIGRLGSDSAPTTLRDKGLEKQWKGFSSGRTERGLCRRARGALAKNTRLARATSLPAFRPVADGGDGPSLLGSRRLNPGRVYVR
jgi:hypothetical protein